MTVEIMRTDKSACDLRRAAAACRDAKAARRMLAIALILDGTDRKTAARTAGWIARRCVTGYTVTMTRGLRVSRTGVRQDGSPCSA